MRHHTKAFFVELNLLYKLYKPIWIDIPTPSFFLSPRAAPIMLLLSLLGGLLTKGVSRRTKQYLLLLILLVQESHGHLVLTYPPARQYPLDFSDNYRTRPPCGMPKSKTVVLFFRSSFLTLQHHLNHHHK